MKNKFLLTLLVSLTFYTSAQKKDRVHHVLEKNIIGKTYTYGKWSAEGDFENHYT